MSFSDQPSWKARWHRYGQARLWGSGVLVSAVLAGILLWDITFTVIGLVRVVAAAGLLLLAGGCARKMWHLY